MVSMVHEFAALEPALLRNAFAAYPSGVVAIAGLTPDGPAGLAASSFTSVSLEPPLVSVSIAKSSGTWGGLRSLPRLGLSVLGADQGALCRQLAGRDASRRFESVSWHSSAEGSVFIEGASLWLDCVVETEVAAGDHVVALLGLDGVSRFADVEPLVFHGSQFRRLSADLTKWDVLSRGW